MLGCGCLGLEGGGSVAGGHHGLPVRKARIPDGGMAWAGSLRLAGLDYLGVLFGGYRFRGKLKVHVPFRRHTQISHNTQKWPVVAWKERERERVNVWLWLTTSLKGCGFINLANSSASFSRVIPTGLRSDLRWP